MPFESVTERVVYENNPLFTVTCQLRFPTILKIASEAPAAFQERIRSGYPILSEDPGAQVAPLELRNLLHRTGTDKNFEFKSADGYWQINLTRDFLALTTRQYLRWEEFRRKLKESADALIDIYHPAFFSRVGLRYQDVIRKRRLGVEDKDWSQLLRSEIAGELKDPYLASRAIEVASENLFELPNAGRVRVRHGLVSVDDDIAYLIDSDFFDENRTETADVWKTLDSFNQYAGRFFRWCISDDLHRAMGPSPIPDSPRD